MPTHLGVEGNPAIGKKLHTFGDEFGKLACDTALGFAVRPLKRTNDGAELFAIHVGYHPLVHSAV